MKSGSEQGAADGGVLGTHKAEATPKTGHGLVVVEIVACSSIFRRRTYFPAL